MDTDDFTVGGMYSYRDYRNIFAHMYSANEVTEIIGMICWKKNDIIVILKKLSHGYCKVLSNRGEVFIVRLSRMNWNGSKV